MLKPEIAMMWLVPVIENASRACGEIWLSSPSKMPRKRAFSGAGKISSSTLAPFSRSSYNSLKRGLPAPVLRRVTLPN